MFGKKVDQIQKKVGTVYPECLMILSCVMLCMNFVCMFYNGKWIHSVLGELTSMYSFKEYLVITTSKIKRSLKLLYTPKSKTSHPKKEFPKQRENSKKTNISLTKTKSTRVHKLGRLALLTAIGRMHSMPTIQSSSQHELRKQMHKHRSYNGVLNQATLSRKPVPYITQFRDHLVNKLEEDTLLFKGIFSFIVDTGCSCSCSPFKEDFETLMLLEKPITLNGVVGEVQCTHAGVIKVQTINTKGEVITLKTPGYYNPHQKVRLFSPQAHFWFETGRKGAMFLSWTKTTLNLPNQGILPIQLDSTTFMPLLSCFHDCDKVIKELANPITNPCVTDDNNPLLTRAQKELLKWHYKLNHVGFQHLHWLLRNFKIFGVTGVIGSGNDVITPLCSCCLTGGMQKLPTKGNIHTKVRECKSILKHEKTIPGALIFSDQFVSSEPGKHYNLRGQQLGNTGYRGGTVFYDAASSFISIHHQVGFTSSETLKSMLTFEREAAQVGITIEGYNTDNGVYTSKEIMGKMMDDKQTLRLSGVGAHHQNGPAENSIKNITRRAQIAMFHAALRWPEKYDKRLWPLAMSHAVHIHNHTPRRSDKYCPIELWTQTKSTHSHLTNTHPWGCPVHVLDPRLQDGNKIPRFNPRARLGIYMGISPLHASSVGVILNPTTNWLSPQFHCIYDDFFQTVSYTEQNPPPNWEQIIIDGKCESYFDDIDDAEMIEDNWETIRPDRTTSESSPEGEQPVDGNEIDIPLDPPEPIPDFPATNPEAEKQREPVPDQPRPPQKTEVADPPRPRTRSTRRSSRTRKPVE